jgi:hypothetical protein
MPDHPVRDLLTDRSYSLRDGVTLAPYGVLWLEVRAPESAAHA